MNNCHVNANCTNTEGSFTCSCNPGYTGDGVNCTSKLNSSISGKKRTSLGNGCTSLYNQYSFHYLYALCFLLTCMLVPLVHLFIQFIDVNECELETYPCSPNANCTDTDGSFNCTCTEGFEGDGFNCTGISVLSINTVSDMCLVNYFISCCRYSRV